VLACDHKVAALPLIALTGDSQYPLAVLVKLGLDYLPAGLTAAGVTLRLAVSAGGLFMPLLGLVADHCGPCGVFIVLAHPAHRHRSCPGASESRRHRDSPHPAPTRTRCPSDRGIAAVRTSLDIRADFEH